MGSRDFGLRLFLSLFLKKLDGGFGIGFISLKVLDRRVVVEIFIEFW